jgi:hypothetical protein
MMLVWQRFTPSTAFSSATPSISHCQTQRVCLWSSVVLEARSSRDWRRCFTTSDHLQGCAQEAPSSLLNDQGNGGREHPSITC